MRVALLLAGPATAPRGSQVLVRQLALGLAERGHVVRLVTYGGRRAGPPGPRVGRLLSDLWLTGRLWRLVAREPIDVVHAHNYEAAIAGPVEARPSGRPRSPGCKLGSRAPGSSSSLTPTAARPRASWGMFGGWR